MPFAVNAAHPCPKRKKTNTLFLIVLIFALSAIVLAAVLIPILLNGSNKDDDSSYDDDREASDRDFSNLDFLSKKPLNSGSREEILAVDFGYDCFYPLQKFSYHSYNSKQYASADNENLIVSRNGVVGSWTGNGYSWVDSFDGTVQMERGSAGTQIYTPSGIISIADSWKGQLAAEGGYVSYCKDGGELWIYDIEKDKHTRIHTSVTDNHCISPNGEYVVFCVEQQECTLLMLYHDGETTLLNVDLYPLSVSNCGTCIYARDDDGDVYALDEEGTLHYLEDGMEDDGYSYETVYILNRDHTEILFVADSRLYFSEHGSGPERLCYSNKVNLLLPNFCTESTNTYCVDHLYDQIIYSPYDYSMFYLDSDLYVDLIDYPWRRQLTPDGRYLYAMYSDRLLRYDIYDDMDDRTIIRDDLTDFAVTSDGVIYYLTEDDCLWRQGNEEDEKIFENVLSLEVTSHDLILFLADYNHYQLGGSLYAVDEKGKVKPIDEAVHNYHIYGTDVYYEANCSLMQNHMDVYAGDGSIEFRRVLKNVYSPYGVAAQ